MFKIIITPRFGDTDGLKHINNNRITEWFELAENEIYKIFTPNLNLSNKEWKLLLIENESQFLKQTYYGENVEIKSYIQDIEETYFTIYSEAWQNGELKAVGKSKFLYYDWIELKELKIPEDIVKNLEKHLKGDMNV